MVATAHFLASDVADTVMREGGNAVDAGVAAAATIAVVAPHLNGVGGDLFAIVWAPGMGRPVGLNASWRSGSKASIERVRSQGHVVMPQRGPLTITVPGAVSGWVALSRRFGSRDLESLLAPAITFALSGAPVTEVIARSLRSSSALIDGDSSLGRIYKPKGRLVGARDRFRNPLLAESLREIGRSNGESFYRGSLAEAIVGDLSNVGALLDLDDLHEHEPDWVEPLHTECFGSTIYELPPNTQGITALELFNLVQEMNVSRLKHNSARYIDALASACALAYEDRDAFITDPDYAEIPTALLASREHARARLASAPHTTVVADSGDTIYLCCVDSQGLVVSLIQSHYMGFGSGIMSRSTGIHFQNRGAYFSLDPRHVNRLQPRKRTMHTLIPALALKDDHLDLVFGTMGGDAQPQIQLQVILNRKLFGMEIGAAISAPRFVSAPTLDEPKRLLVEARVSSTTVSDLNWMGYQVHAVEDWSSTMGHAQAIERRATGGLEGAADPRGDGSAVGR